MEVSIEHSAKLLHEANHIVLTAHIHPDGDALGSLLALYAYLVTQGKTVTMLLDDDVPRSFKFLSAWEKIEKPENVLPDVDLLVVLDASDLERIGRVKEVVKAPILNIDHHISNLKFAEYWYIDSQVAATGELIFRLLKAATATITSSMATALFVAIATDCGFFRYANTSAETLKIASELVTLGAKPHIISEYLDTKPRAVIEVLPKVLETLEIIDCGQDRQIASLTLCQKILTDFKDDTEGFINYPRNIEGVEIAIMFKEIDNCSVRVSFRSKTVDVSQLALAFGGGGHARAAGCTVTKPLAKAKQLVIAAAKQQLANSF
ncbi:DHH family phosphoesterase [Sporomusa acidovorans]|uniref:Bifunctional oligoribonuclease and PAP phosphatase NrnA n=1 Tax=Sporomusa acidovorans (strain ATCC 49682 / DSM 3132 / Mol) TaxID=1123286 RepID=A0ABZ3J3G8_SPOA4|nr:bifunctional oligoribonuclease/PAP phosphatase NrnA [Sporomusa acidovorans]OZC20113.1 bifunctional oligoribonuclease and PAP phosphatase NrnA [Sporomusa acidovorans DSM 3132]SDD44729.1 phosphoesterase RecJ domain-containing protein [Sporomusa acidovorans]